MSNDPVFQKEDGWHFWDEAWADSYGPYPSEEEARRQVLEYAKCMGLL